MHTEHKIDVNNKRLYNLSILEQVGNTPLIKINNIASKSKGVEIFAKAEWFNPGGSVKDRPALWMMRDGEKKKLLTKDKVVLDATSGNTGIAYAMIGAVLGYKVELVMPGNVTRERVKIVNSYGARVNFSNPMEGSDGAQIKMDKLYKMNPEKYFVPGQYTNEANPQAHYETTGPEIIEQTEGRITHFVAGIGTSGTIMGTRRRLKEFNKNIKIVAVEPDTGLHGIEGLKHMETSIVPTIYHEELLDDKINVKTEDTYEMVSRLSKEEGLLVGHSSGAALKAALDLADTLKEGVIVVIFPDGGDRYLSLK